MHLACSDWSILNSDGSDLTSGTQCRFKVRQGTSDRRPLIRTGRADNPRRPLFEELKAWKEVFRVGLSANWLMLFQWLIFHNSSFMTSLWRHNDVIMELLRGLLFIFDLCFAIFCITICPFFQSFLQFIWKMVFSGSKIS